MLEVVRGNVPEKIHFLRPRGYSVGRARYNDVSLTEPSISKNHARILHENGGFVIEDQGSLHGVYVNSARVQRSELVAGAQIQLGNVTLKFSAITGEGATEQIAELPWIEQQHLLLSLVQALNSTLVLSQVLEQVLDAVMQITRAERGFLLLVEGNPDPARPVVAGLSVHVGRRRGASLRADEMTGLSSSVVRRAVETGETVATGNAVADPALGQAQSVVLLDLRTIVCIPLRSPRGDDAEGVARAVGAIYVDNQETSAPFSADSLKTVEALARHAALAIENALLFERERDRIEELRSAQKQLLQSEKLATIGQMAAGIAHELNTPLTYIMGNLELLESQAATPAQKEMISSIAVGAERITGLAQRLLAFSRPAEEEPVALAVNEVIERSLELCHYQILKGGVQLRKELEAGLPAVQGVANQLETALINLVVNAVHAMEGGGTLQVSTASRDGHVEIAVADSGQGIPVEIQPTIFEPFFTTKPEGKGTGLGLSTVLMIVERHKGRIEFTSAPGRGTTFRISLPVIP
ncbi:MAG TPA: ATP-binding protein [Vicinamibacteria bacterium]|nr:ATP-binding protein [Vicinamibacteria bacterium]